MGEASSAVPFPHARASLLGIGDYVPRRGERDEVTIMDKVVLQSASPLGEGRSSSVPSTPWREGLDEPLAWTSVVCSISWRSPVLLSALRTGAAEPDLTDSREEQWRSLSQSFFG